MAKHKLIVGHVTAHPWKPAQLCPKCGKVVGELVPDEFGMFQLRLIDDPHSYYFYHGNCPHCKAVFHFNGHIKP